MTAFGSRVRRLLAHRAWAPALIVASVLLCATSLDNGLLMDDHIQRLMLRGDHDLPWPPTAIWDLYALIPGDPEFMERSIELGTAPWWSAESFKATFLRPLSSLTIALDHAAWPDRPRLMHAHSLLWLAAMLVAAALLYRRLLGPGWPAGLAIALYALDDANLHPATWVANRNSLIATLFGLLALVAHDKWRRDRWRPGAVLGPLLLLIGLAAGEFALGAAAFVLSHAIFLDRGRRSERLLALAPYAVLIVAWRVAYSLLGYGTHGSDLYIDPLADPTAFLAAAAGRLPMMLLALLGPPGSEITVMLPEEARPLHIALGIAWIALFAAVAWPLLKRDRRARFFAAGAVLSLLPACATFPHDRLLLLAGLGGMGLIALVLGLFLDRPEWRPDKWRWRLPAAALAVLLVLLHLVVPLLSRPLRATFVKQLAAISDHATKTLEAGPGFGEQTLVVISAPDIFLSAFLPVWRASYGLANPKRIEVISNSLDPVEVRRVDERSLLVRIEAGHFRIWTHQLVRLADERMDVGYEVKRPGVTYEVIEATDEGEPVAVRVTFDRPLEDPSLRWVNFEGHGYARFIPPEIGRPATSDIDESILFDVPAE